MEDPTDVKELMSRVTTIAQAMEQVMGLVLSFVEDEKITINVQMPLQQAQYRLMECVSWIGTAANNTKAPKLEVVPDE